MEQCYKLQYRIRAVKFLKTLEISTNLTQFHVPLYISNLCKMTDETREYMADL
jgi:hypothetical protein